MKISKYLMYVGIGIISMAQAATPIHNEIGSDISILSGGTRTSIKAGDTTKEVDPYYGSVNIELPGSDFGLSWPKSLKQKDIDFIRLYKQGNDIHADFSAKSGAQSVNNVNASRLVHN